MKRKSLLFAMMLCLACFGVANAQQTLTVCNGTVEEQHIPFYAYSGDTQGTTSEFIIPESNLTALNGKEITALKFYLSQSQSKTWTANYQIYMAQVATTQLTRTIGPDAGTIVYEGTVDASGSEMTITFNQGNYTYNGGHLLIGTYVETAGAWDSNGKFYGIQATSAAYLSGSWGGYDDGAIDFIPKTTFTYLTNDPYITLTSASATVLTGFTETLTATYGNVTGTPSISYTSSNTSVATVIGNGTTATVTGVAAGTATITATMTVNGTNYTGTCDIIVEDPSYCTPSYSQTSDYIKSFVTTGGTTNINNTNTGQGTGGYSDFYNSHSASIGDGETLSFTVTRGYNDSYKYAIWVDWNHDYVFDVNTETMAQQTTSVSSDWSSSFTIPVGTAAGDYRMRVEMLYGSSNTLNPCVSATYGEVEDYKLTIVASNPCSAPTNLQASQVGTTTAHLSWDGTNDSYVLQYRVAAQPIMNMNAWQQVGEDVITSHELTQYPFDLSDYAGQTGYIAIRHYAVSDMFILAIDDIEVTDANGTVVLSEGFDSGIPSTWDNIDYDGDGYVWGYTSSSLANGYCAYSESYSNDTYEALTPDNWLIIPNVTLGGTLTLYALGLDSQGYHEENFGVFVSTQSYAPVAVGAWSPEIPTTTTSYDLTGLTANTLYDWQVKGICSGYPDPSNWASSSFSTIPEGFKTFVTEGNWNVANNWFPVGVPAITDEVAIAAPVTIPANVVALAKKATIETGGSITIEDGGQLKHGSATLKVTMKKSIAGYGAGNENDKDHYYFIASPFGGITQLTSNTNWSKVLHLTEGNYDFYGFDPTQELEWINYESSSSHALFTSDNNIEGMQDGIGYLYANEDSKVLEFIGTAKKNINVTQTKAYTYDSESTDQWNGWTLLGNPYTCDAYISYVDNNGDALSADFYTLNNSKTYTILSSSDPLAPCTAAFINYSATGTIQFSSEAPAKANRTGMINMTLSQGRGNVDQARLRFGEGFGLEKKSFANSSRIYMPVDGIDYAVAYTEEQGEMPVNFKAEENGTYTLSFSNEEVTFGYLHLIDNMTGNDVDLLSTPSYTFEARTTDYTSRFKLVFATGNADDNFAFYSNGSFVINNEGNATLQVMDVTGRMISSEAINGCASVNVNAAQGIYMLRLINGENVKVQKVVVR